jgi:hypothetical protein
MQFAGRDVVARKEDVGGYWKKAMDSQAMPEAIQSRIHPQSEKGIHFAKDFHVSGPPGGVNIGWTHHPPHPQKKIRKRGSFCQGCSC